MSYGDDSWLMRLLRRSRACIPFCFGQQKKPEDFMSLWIYWRREWHFLSGPTYGFPIGFYNILHIMQTHTSNTTSPWHITSRKTYTTTSTPHVKRKGCCKHIEDDKFVHCCSEYLPSLGHKLNKNKLQNFSRKKTSWQGGHCLHIIFTIHKPSYPHRSNISVQFLLKSWSHKFLPNLSLSHT